MGPNVPEQAKGVGMGREGGTLGRASSIEAGAKPLMHQGCCPTDSRLPCGDGLWHRLPPRRANPRGTAYGVLQLQ